MRGRARVEIIFGRSGQTPHDFALFFRQLPPRAQPSFTATWASGICFHHRRIKHNRELEVWNWK
jgi:hypothetical protein